MFPDTATFIPMLANTIFQNLCSVSNIGWITSILKTLETVHDIRPVDVIGTASSRKLSRYLVGFEVCEEWYGRNWIDWFYMLLDDGFKPPCILLKSRQVEKLHIKLSSFSILRSIFLRRRRIDRFYLVSDDTIDQWLWVSTISQNLSDSSKFIVAIIDIRTLFDCPVHKAVDHRALILFWDVRMEVCIPAIVGRFDVYRGFNRSILPHE